MTGVPDGADLLAEVVRATATAGGADEVLHRVARLLTPIADWVLADRLEDPDLVSRVVAYGPGGPVHLPSSAGGDGARRSAAGSIGLLPLLAAQPQRLLRLDRARLEELSAAAEPHLAMQARLGLQLGGAELLLLGLVARDALVGVITLSRRTPFSPAEVGRLHDLALHVGLALDAARLLAVQTEVATALQNSLLPPVPSVPGLRLAARYDPASRGLDVGGDWYDAFPTESGLVLAVGDASGHDVAAAARMADLRNLLRAYAVDRAEPPSAVVTRLERSADALGLDSTATCVLARLVPVGEGRWDAVWTSAGHLPPVLVHDGHAVLLETAADLMLGVQVGTARTDHQLQLVPGDLLVLYTDGLVEVRGTSLEQRLELLRRTVEQDAHAPPDALAELLLAAFGDDATDDRALLVVQVLPEQP